MKIIVVCEFSGIVRDAFIRKGHDAISADLLPTERPGPHLISDAYEIDYAPYDIAICHPPCRYLAVSGARYMSDPVRIREQQKALNLVKFFLSLDLRVCVENPISIISSRIRKPDQIIQPWMFGIDESKATCFWLKGLEPLRPTKVTGGTFSRILAESPGDDRWKNRSRTYLAIAEAMASQWG